MRRLAAALLPVGLGVLVVGPGHPEAQSGRPPAAPPPSQGTTTDPAFDRERPADPQQAGKRSWMQLLAFRSTRTAEQTSRWLGWALERHGHVDEGAYRKGVSDVRFGLTKDTEVVRRYLEQGREKGTGRDRSRDIVIALRDEDQMPDRVAWALVHLGRLCGAEVKIEY